MVELIDTTPTLEALIDPTATFKLLGSGYVFSEGPAWNHAAQYLEFSDIPGDARWRWSEEGGVELVMLAELQGQRHGVRAGREPPHMRAGHQHRRPRAGRTVIGKWSLTTTRAST